jgi:hypothetical protein
VVGPPVNLTARLQAAAASGEVVLSAAIVERVRDARVGGPSRMRVKGVARPVTVYRLQGQARTAGAATGRVAPAARAGMEPAPGAGATVVPLRRRPPVTAPGPDLVCRTS